MKTTKSLEILSLKECLLSDSIPSNKKIKKSNFKSEGKYPIIDQSEKFIAGFTDDKNLIFGTKPVIVFGDHTKRLKYIDFDFCVGADGTKVLIPNERKILPKFLYYQLKFIPLTDAGYNRHYKFIRSKKLIIPDKDIQTKVISTFDSLEKIKMCLYRKDRLINEYIKSMYFELFGDPTLNEKRFSVKKLGTISKLDMGGTPPRKIKEYWENGTINLMKSGDIKGDFITKVPNKITQKGLENSNAKLYKKGDVVIALNGQGKTRGTTSILDVVTSSNQSVVGISPTEEILSEYLHYNLKYRYKEIRNLTGDKERSGLNLSILRNLNIVVPNIEAQDSFSKVIKKVRNFGSDEIPQRIRIGELQKALVSHFFDKTIEINA